MAEALLSISINVLAHSSSIWPVVILEMVSGDTLSSSTNGPSAFSIRLRFSNLLLSALERDCSVSMSADTVERSLRKSARFISTEFRMSSHATMDRCKASNRALSSSSTIGKSARDTTNLISYYSHGNGVTHIRLHSAAGASLWHLGRSSRRPAPLETVHRNRRRMSGPPE